MRLQNDYDISHPFHAKVMMNSRLTPESSPEDVRELSVRIESDDFKCRVGQTIGVLIEGPHAFGNRVHMRLYTVADMRSDDSFTFLDLCVRRCDYIDPISGERYPGIASHFLCDSKVGDPVTLTGPYPMPFEIPENPDANVLMIGVGTGIAPFRAFIKTIYEQRGDWKGKVRLFYGARSGLEMLYQNDKNRDLANYYDEATFKAFQAVSPRPHLDDDIAIDETIHSHGDEVWELINSPKTQVYVAGLERVSYLLDRAMVRLAGSEKAWRRKKAELKAGERWQELLY